jgi:DNA-binding response OmpR family regulator
MIAEIDLVVSDIMLPGKISGWDVFRNLSEEKSDTKYLLIIGYSSEAQDDLEVPIMYKSFRQEELLSKVNQILS